MPENREKLYQLEKSPTGRTTLVLYTFYPDAEVSTGPYCFDRIPVFSKSIPQVRKALADQGFIQREVATTVT